MVETGAVLALRTGSRRRTFHRAGDGYRGLIPKQHATGESLRWLQCRNDMTLGSRVGYGVKELVTGGVRRAIVTGCWCVFDGVGRE
jgi:hypothetical protein